jgi:tetratricopeptide (TPR) repeat protein
MQHVLYFISRLLVVLIFIFSNIIRAQSINDSIDKITFFNSIESYKESYAIVENTATYVDDEAMFSFFYQAGIAASGVHDYEKALQWFDRAEALNPEDIEVKRKRAVALSKSGDLPGAIEIFWSVVRKDSLATSDRLWLAKLYSQQDMADSALRVLQHRPKLLSNHFKMMHSEARLLAKNKDYFRAGILYKKLTERKPEDESLLLEYARILYKAHFYGDIIDLHEELFSKIPTHEIAFIIGTAFQVMNEEEKALGWYMSAAELAIPATIDIYYSYAALSAERLGKKGLALKMYQKAMEYNPDDGYYAYFSAVLYDEVGDKTKAKNMFERFLSSDQMTENNKYAEYAEDKIGEYRRVEFMKRGR